MFAPTSRKMGNSMGLSANAGSCVPEELLKYDQTTLHPGRGK
jgi:hypothetical protein